MQELFKQALFEKIEDEYDILSYEQAKQEFEKNPVTYTHEEFWSGILD